jgi:erythromycin esterase-like protein
VREALAGLTQPEGIAGFDEVRRLEALAGRLDHLAPELEAACGPPAAHDLRDTVEVLAASLRYFLERSAASDDTSPAGLRALRGVYDRRERRMDARFARFVAGLPAEARVALLLHNLHAARASESLDFGRAPHSAAMWRSIGSHLESRFPGQAYVIWLLYARGTRLDARQADGAAAVSPLPGSLEEHLARVPGPYLVFLDDAPAGTAFDLRTAFGTDTSYGSGVLRGVLDALVYLPEAHAP